MPTDVALLIRLLLAAGLASAIGLERELTDQPAGFRTHILVGLGAALFTVLSAYGFIAAAGIGPQGAVRADITRIASQIVVGIGFIGGGVIFKSGSNIRGLTTAATLWVTAAIGTAAAIGALALAVGTTAITVVALVGLRPLRRLLHRHFTNVEEFTIEGGGRLGVEALITEMSRRDIVVEEVTISSEDGTRSVRMLVRLPAEAKPSDVAATIAEVPSVTSVDWSTH